MLVFLADIENIVVLCHLFCCFRPSARSFYSQLKRAVELKKNFHNAQSLKENIPAQQPVRAGVLL